MIDPQRLIDAAGTPEARLLSSAIEEPPPAHLLARTLAAVAFASAAGHASAAGAAGGGILGGAAIGALAGVLVVGGYGLFTAAASSPRGAPAAATASAAPREAPPEPALAPPKPPPIAPPAVPQVATGEPPLPASAARPTALAAEIELLDEASRALHQGNPARAKEILDRYARQVPRGQLGREAAKLRAEVAVALRNGGGDPERTIP